MLLPRRLLLEEYMVRARFIELGPCVHLRNLRIEWRFWQFRGRFRQDERRVAQAALHGDKLILAVRETLSKYG